MERGSVDVAVYVTEAAATEGLSVGGLPLTWHAVPGWEPPAARRSRSRPSGRHRGSGPSPSTGCPPRSSATPAVSRASSTSPAPGRGVALLAVPMSALARPGADPATVEAAFSAVRDLLRP
ncbi:hypothetical protein [Streptomyces sp. NPDC051001]|uniref:hypothetical protein n=1 Tax=Streptomyces sp. NPDC051001 TaxID=3155795 RepID=UPI003432CFCE